MGMKSMYGAGRVRNAARCGVNAILRPNRVLFLHAHPNVSKYWSLIKRYLQQPVSYPPRVPLL